MAAEGTSTEMVKGEEVTTESFFDTLAKGLANGKLSRRKALRMLGSALVGGVLATVPGIDWAAKPGTAASPRLSTEQPYSGLRFYKQVGIKVWPDWNGNAQSFQSLYNQYMKPQYHGAGDVYFTVRKNWQWADVLVNENVTPTHAQMRDPNWKGYLWNQPGGDTVAKMFDAPCVAEGKCKVSIHLSTSATSGDATPNFMLNKGLGWVGSKGLRHTSFHKPEAVQYASEWIMAAMDRYADDPRVGSIKLGEYFPDPTKPANWDRAAFVSGYKTLLENVAAGLKRDANGDRVTVYQAEPILQPGLLECADFARLNIGIATSDPRMFDTAPQVQQCRRSLHGVVPMAPPGDEWYHTSRHVVTWDGTPNPWGYTAGQGVVITLPQVAWYYGHLGPMPMDQEFIVSIGIADQFRTTLDQFGESGTYRARWGGIPYTR